ncbi:MAG: hypothetical protein ACRECS_14785 [Sphingomonas sp.]
MTARPLCAVLTIMNRERVARQPGHGVGQRRGAAGLAAPSLMLSLALMAQIAPAHSLSQPHIPYQPILDTVMVTAPQEPPRIAYPPLPVDDRIAPDEFAYDDIVEDLPTPVEQAALFERLKLSQLSQNYRPPRHLEDRRPRYDPLSVRHDPCPAARL